jgi:hypothetical protein
VPLYEWIDFPSLETVAAVSISKMVFHYFRGRPGALLYEYTYSQRNGKRRRLKAKHIQNLITKLKHEQTD